MTYSGNRKCLRRGKICLCKGCYVPTLSYKAKTWAWSKASISKLKTAETAFLRSTELKTK
jgi:hypothetical protein